MRGPYVGSREESVRPRGYWRGIDTENGEWDGVEWLFETVEDDNGRCIAIKQVIIRPSGVVSRYCWNHLEDAHGFLRDRPVGDSDKVSPISAEDFRRCWDE